MEFSLPGWNSALIHPWQVLHAASNLHFCRDRGARAPPVRVELSFNCPFFPEIQPLVYLVALCFSHLVSVGSTIISSDEANRLSVILLFIFKFCTSPTVSIATSVLHFITSICILYSIYALNFVEHIIISVIIRIT